MAVQGLNRRSWQGVLRLALCVLLFSSLFLLSEATQNSADFGQLQVWLLLINSVGLVVLIGLIVLNLWRLVSQYRHGQVGSRLTTRLLAMVVVLSLAPGVIVYYFSMQFLRGGIDSWFDIRVEQALDDALSLSQASLDLRMRDLLKRSQATADSLIDVTDTMAPLALGEMRERIGASELTLLASGGRIVASSSQDTGAILPDRPEDTLLLQLRQGRSYVGLDPVERGGLHVRVLVLAPSPQGPQEERILQALFPVSPRLADLAENVQRIYGEYREISYLREPLKQSFMLTLSFVLLLSLLFAVWSAFYLARRLVAPIRDLAEGTRAVAAGDYGTQLPPAGRDELGFLVQSFNDMSRRVAQTREAAKRGQVQVETQRAYLEAVLSRLSSGVLALDIGGNLRTYNQAASEILAAPLNTLVGRELGTLLEEQPHLAPFTQLVHGHLDETARDWREEVVLEGADGRRVLICSGARLPGGYGTGGYVIVFDDVTTLIQAQRDAAWGEVARRLAHEIKNPLTPIQLSAERIRHKYLARMEGRDAEVLERATRTIVQQVDAMKEMVNAFSDYARPPKLALNPLDLNGLVQEVVDLYRNSADHAQFELHLDSDLPQVLADAGRLRQLLHNLVKNALEAAPERPEIILTTRRAEGRYAGQVELEVRDNGPGFADAMLGKLYEPYVTTKPKGTGLGLAIVKKIVEEHNGAISARNVDGGAQVVVRLPEAAPDGAPAGRLGVRPLTEIH